MAFPPHGFVKINIDASVYPIDIGIGTMAAQNFDDRVLVALTQHLPRCASCNGSTDGDPRNLFSPNMLPHSRHY